MTIIPQYTRKRKESLVGWPLLSGPAGPFSSLHGVPALALPGSAEPQETVELRVTSLLPTCLVLSS